jgi:hypothetical protein
MKWPDWWQYIMVPNPSVAWENDKYVIITFNLSGMAAMRVPRFWVVSKDASINSSQELEAQARKFYFLEEATRAVDG